jgi:hypothetical protein
MKLIWSVTKRDASYIKAFVREHKANAFVRARVERNVNGGHAQLTKAVVWRHLVSCLLTTQQRSGPTSRVQAFVSARPFPLGYGRIREAANIERFTAKAIRDFGGLRRADTIAKELAENAGWFEGARWTELRTRLEALPGARSHLRERETARWLAAGFRGRGPKQSRNFLQSLGLTKYETPIDSRIIKWLNTIEFPIHLSSVGLSDPDYYEFVSDGFRELAEAAGVLPCVLDAAVFAAVDGDGWNDVDVMF